MDIVGFLKGITPDHRGRTLAMVFAFSDERAEQTHDYMQWLFPLAEPSGSVHGAPILSDLDIEDIKLSPAAQANLIKASGWFFEFLVRNQRWIAKYDHNQLRITRIIKSLRLLVGDKEANKFRQSLFDYLGDDIALIVKKAKSFWNQA
jgi:hypothetical protein